MMARAALSTGSDSLGLYIHIGAILLNSVRAAGLGG